MDAGVLTHTDLSEGVLSAPEGERVGTGVCDVN